MKFEISENSLEKISADGIVVFAFEKDKKFVKTKGFLELDKIFQGYPSESIASEDFKPNSGNFFQLQTFGKILSPKIYVLGLGEQKDFDFNVLRKAFTVFAKNISGKVSSLAVSRVYSQEGDLETSLQTQMVAEGLLLGSYKFNKYKKNDGNHQKELEVIIFSENNKNTHEKIKEGIAKAQIYYNATKIARDLVNEPSAVVNPAYLADFALDIAKRNPLVKCTIFDKNEVEKMGMGAFLGVAQASDIDTPPKFIYLEYNPLKQGPKTKLAIVGKGITFDSGGISIKPENSMATMKCDMSGAATVLGVFSVISKIEPRVPVMGLIAATPNLISGKSLVPGDVLKVMDGKTIEILNTDAEGRVTMADSIAYAIKKGATHILDLATLTGACEVALGTDIAGLFSNDEKFAKLVKGAALKSGEKVWELPLEKDYRELNKSDVADISNIPSSRYGGAITAALFLQEFVQNKPWVHLDIAGPAFAEKVNSFGPKGGTGFGVRMLLNLLEDINDSKVDN